MGNCVVFMIVVGISYVKIVEYVSYFWMGVFSVCVRLDIVVSCVRSMMFVCLIFVNMMVYVGRWIICCLCVIVLLRNMDLCVNLLMDVI